MVTLFVVITGMPGTGKTTIVKRMVNELIATNNRTSGFYTEEVRNDRGNRIGFDIVSLNATKRGILARNDQTCTTFKHKVGNYTVDTSSVDVFLRPIHETLNATDILVIDEIGKMELKSVFFTKFVTDVARATDHSLKIVVATVPVTTTIPIVEEIKSHRNSKLFTITKLNRNAIYDDIKKTVDGHLINASDE
ncbi:nucleoside-triphosphatase THEP1 [Bradysia coprophila]|uniref:nucleoside-triphosphatase THEP1 n=1 Tax=Bradysia coprophila TaxID=38358 RepID=UPI00187D7457|nr:nucleoside-triphosphatase THEP1 [Bradysia coprophila]